MAFKTLLVHAWDEQSAGDIAEAAVTLVKGEPTAHIIGLYVIPGMLTYPGMTVGVTSDILDSHQQQYQEFARRIENAFERAAGGGNVTVEWRIDESSVPSVAGTVIQHSRAADLVVIDRPDESDLDFDRRAFAGRMLVESGRPILIVPRTRSFKSMGESVLLAWNGSKESARAAFDALPLLKKAKSTSVVCVDPAQDADQDAPCAGTEIAAALARHGVKTETVRDVASGTSAGQVLLDRCADIGCDMIVMGGYGHSRFRELLLGGVTRHVLDHMRVPVLMSH